MGNPHLKYLNFLHNSFGRPLESNLRYEKSECKKSSAVSGPGCRAYFETSFYQKRTSNFFFS